MPKKFDLQTKLDMQNEVLRLHSEGNTIASICRMENMPSRGSIYAWIIEDEAFAQQFARIRDMAMDAIADEALSIADTPLNGVTIQESDQFGRTTITSDMLGHRKLQVETRLKLLAKWSPKKYGDKIQTEHSGEIKVIPMQVQVSNDESKKDLDLLNG